MSLLTEEERLKGVDSNPAALELTDGKGRLSLHGSVGRDGLGLLYNTTAWMRSNKNKAAIFTANSFLELFSRHPTPKRLTVPACIFNLLRSR
jgi:hypothetical protein